MSPNSLTNSKSKCESPFFIGNGQADPKIHTAMQVTHDGQNVYQKKKMLKDSQLLI